MADAGDCVFCAIAQGRANASIVCQDDSVLRVYPEAPRTPPRQQLEEHAERLRAALAERS